MSASMPMRTTRRGLALGKSRGMPTAATSSDSESGSRRTPVAMGDSPSTTERNSGTMKNSPAGIRNWKRNVISPPVSCLTRSSAGEMSGSLPASSSRLCQRRNSQRKKRPAMMNQIVSERPNSDVAPSLGRNQPQVDDLSTPRTISARPIDDTDGADQVEVRPLADRLVGGAARQEQDGDDDDDLAGEDVAPREVRGHEAADHRADGDGDRAGGGDEPVRLGRPPGGKLPAMRPTMAGMISTAPMPSRNDQPMISTVRFGESAVVIEPQP